MASNALSSEVMIERAAILDEAGAAHPSAMLPGRSALVIQFLHLGIGDLPIAFRRLPKRSSRSARR
jgi:hypothetical protein